jgi:hypothetical protein
MPDGEHAFGDLTIVEDGGYEHPWPRIYLADYANAEAGLYGEDDMFLVYKLRAKWRLIDRDHVRLRRELATVLSSNDKDNNVLNHQRQNWNCVLKGSGFPEFQENDLRGSNLSGLTIAASGGGRLLLGNVRLDYAECHLLRLLDANLYGATLTGVKATRLDLSHATAHGVSFRCCYLPDGRFLGADLGSCDFTYALISHCLFDGANCYGADFSSALCLKASFDCYPHPQTSKRTYSNLADVVWDDNTRFQEVVFNEFLIEQNPKLAEHIRDQRNAASPKRELVSSVELKPGAFGFSIDLQKVFSALKLAWKGRKRRTQRSGARDGVPAARDP